MPDILDALYFGDIRPHDEETVNAAEIKSAKHSLDICEKKLRETFSSEQNALFEKYLDHLEDLKVVREATAFSKGFSLGMKLTLGAMNIE